MNISPKSRHGLRIMVELAVREQSAGVSLADLSEAQNVPEDELRELLADLAAGGLVRQLDDDGGYQLGRRAMSITALDVVDVLENGAPIVECVGTAANCPRGGICRTRDVWCQVNSAMDRVLDTMTLSGLADPSRSYVG